MEDIPLVRSLSDLDSVATGPVPTTGRTTAPEQDGGDGPRLVTAHWVAAYLGVSRARVYKLCHEGLLDPVKLGRSIRFSPRAVVVWAESGGKSYPGGWRREPVR